MLIGPYDADFLAAWQRVVPQSDCKWSRTASAWRIRSCHAPVLEAIIRDHSPREHVEHAVETPEASAADLLALAPTLGEDVTDTDAGAAVLEGVALGVDAGFGTSSTAARVVVIGKGTKRQLLIVALAELEADS